MNILQLVIYLVIFSCVTLAMEKITNLTMNLYILLNSSTAYGFKDLRGSLNPFAVLEFSKMYKFIVKISIFFIVGVTQLKMTNCYMVICSLHIS